MVTLYHYPYSQHARRVVMLLEEASIPYQLHHVAMDRGEHASPAFLEVNPNGQVPVLVDGERTLAESNAILRYLCAKHELAEWYPRDPSERAEVDQWLDWNQCRLSPVVVDIVLNRVFMGSAGNLDAADQAETRLPALVAILEAQLAKTPFVAGKAITIADLSIASNISHLEFADLRPASLDGWYQEVSALNGFQKARPPLKP
ncbi:MAG: glutathione S-transferase family protein [Myxococcota bacterium]